MSASRHVGLSGISDRKVKKEELFLIRCCFCQFRVTNVEQAKRDIGENYLQTMQYRLQTDYKCLQVMEGIRCNMQLVV